MQLPSAVDLPPDFLRLSPDVAVLRYTPCTTTPTTTTQEREPSNNNTTKNSVTKQDSSLYRYESLEKLEQQVIQQLKLQASNNNNNSTSGSAGHHPLKENRSNSTFQIFTRAVFRDPNIGLGMTLAYEQGHVQVHSVALQGAGSADNKDGAGTTVVGGDDQNTVVGVGVVDNNTTSADKEQKGRRNLSHAAGGGGPSMKAGIRPGDVILGFNGQSLSTLLFLWTRQQQQPSSSAATTTTTTTTTTNSLLHHVVQIIRDSPDPVVIHYSRGHHGRRTTAKEFPIAYVGASLLDETLLDTSADNDNDDNDRMEPPSPSLQQRTVSHHRHCVWSTPFLGQNGEPRIHKLIQLLSSRDLVPSVEEEMNLTAALAQFNERAWEIENFGSLRCSMLNHQHQKHRAMSSSSSSRKSFHDVLIPLVGMRKALSTRILHHFTEGTRVAYTIWVYDVESGLEWHAPLRYMEDFCELRQAATNLIPPLKKLPFPCLQYPQQHHHQHHHQKQPILFGVAAVVASSLRRYLPLADDATLEAQCWQLEKFLRSLCSLLYENQLHPSIGEVTIHVQSFLGCESIDSSEQ